MQNDRNVSSDDKKKISLDNIIDEYKSSKSSKSNDTKLNEAMKKLDDIFNREAEDLAWLDNILNSDARPTESERASTAPAADRPDFSVTKTASEDFSGNANAEDDDVIIATAQDVQDTDFGESDDGASFDGNAVMPDPAVMPAEETDEQKAYALADEIASEDAFGDGSFYDDAKDDGSYNEVLTAENPDNAPSFDDFSEIDDTKIFRSSHRIDIPDPEEDDDFSEWESQNTDTADDEPKYGHIERTSNVEIPQGMTQMDLMNAQSNMAQMPVGAPDAFGGQQVMQYDKRLEKKFLKEQKKLAKAQAKEQARAAKAQKKLGYAPQAPEVPQMPQDMYQQNGAGYAPVQEFPDGQMQQNAYPMQNSFGAYDYAADNTADTVNQGNEAVREFANDVYGNAQGEVTDNAFAPVIENAEASAEQNEPVAVYGNREVAEDVVAEDAVAEEVVAENAVAEEVVAENAVAEDAVAEDAVAEEVVAEEVVAEEAVDTVTEGAFGDDASELPEDIYSNAAPEEDIPLYDTAADNETREYSYGKNYRSSQAPSDIGDIKTEEADPNFDMFEGASAEGEYVHNVEMASQQFESNVDSSLGKLFGVESADDDNNVKNHKKKSEHKKIAKELGAYEEINMADPAAVDAARRRYFVKRRNSMISLFGATLFFLVSLYFEISLLGALPVPGIVSAKTNPLLFALTDLQIMCFGAMFVVGSLISGFYAMIDRRFSPASCALAVFLTCTAQAVVSAVFGAQVKIEMFCCIGCLAMFMLALYDSLKASADYKSFCIASSTANKYGAYELGVDSLECSPFASHIDLEKAKVISVNKGSVYEGFVGRNEKRPEGEKKLGRLTLIITLVSLLVGAFVGVFSDGNITERIYEGITGAAIVIVSSVPINIFFVSALPKYLAVKKGNKIGSTLIGQNASEEYRGLSVVAFDDTEVFLPRDVRISSIKTYGGMALDEAVITMANIYNKLGGPLSKIFAKMVDVKSMRSEVRLVKVYPDAIEVNVDGRDFCLATASYLGANGIRIINDSVDAAFQQSHGSILFMVCSGRVLSKFYIKYTMNPIFEKTLRELQDANLCIGIKTLDPCITNDLVFGCLERANYALSVIKGNSSSDIPTVRNKVNSGVISLGSVHSFLEMLLICEKTGRNVKINNVIKIISSVLCILLSTAFVLTNNGSLNIIFCLLIQLFWLLPVTAISYLNR